MTYLIQESQTIATPDISDLILSEAYKDKKKRTNKRIVVEISSIHEGVTKNYNKYTPEELTKAVPSWMLPYPKPILLNHNLESEPMGRMISAEYRQAMSLKPGYIMLRAAIMDPLAASKVMDGRYLTGSVGGIPEAAICSICHQDVIQASKSGNSCGHKRGRSYDEKVCVYEHRGISFHEYSFVNVPGDSESTIQPVASESAFAEMSVFNVDFDAQTVSSYSEKNGIVDIREYMTEAQAEDAYMHLALGTKTAEVASPKSFSMNTASVENEEAGTTDELENVLSENIEEDALKSLKAEARFADLMQYFVMDNGKLTNGPGLYAAYEGPSENKEAEMGIKCENCAFFIKAGQCHIVDEEIDPMGKCRFAVIPEQLVQSPKSQKSQENVKNMSFESNLSTIEEESDKADPEQGLMTDKNEVNDIVENDEDVIDVATRLSNDLAKESGDKADEVEDATAEEDADATADNEVADEEGTPVEEDAATEDEDAEVEEDKNEAAEDAATEEAEDAEEATVSTEDEAPAAEDVEAKEDEDEGEDEATAEAETDEAPEAEESADPDLQARIDELEAENEKLRTQNQKMKAAIHAELAEKVVSARIAVGHLKAEDRETALEEHKARSASSLADALVDIRTFAENNNYQVTVINGTVPSLTIEAQATSEDNDAVITESEDGETIEEEVAVDPQDLLVKKFTELLSNGVEKTLSKSNS